MEKNGKANAQGNLNDDGKDHQYQRHPYRFPETWIYKSLNIVFDTYETSRNKCAKRLVTKRQIERAKNRKGKYSYDYQPCGKYKDPSEPGICGFDALVIQSATKS